VALDPSQGNHLTNVLRLKSGDSVLVFNGRDGEWRASLAPVGKGRLAVAVGSRVRPQERPGDLHYLFAPLKHARLDFMAQKAVEMGASRLQPVLTRYVQVARVNLHRMRANAIEAAQQCGILTLPDIRAPVGLDRMIAERDPDRILVFCDEDAAVKDPVAALSTALPDCSAGRARRRLRSRRTRGALPAAQHGTSLARPAHPARGHSRGRSARAGRGCARGLALSNSGRIARTSALMALSASRIWRRNVPRGVLNARRRCINSAQSSAPQ